jgi:hypothetical protein
VLVGGLVAQAQVVVFDAAVTFRNTVTATIQEYLASVQREQRKQFWRMSRRLSMFTDLARYRLPEPPRWRTHAWEDHLAFLYSTGFNAVLNYGDASGDAFSDIVQPVLDAEAAVASLPATARRALQAQLATLNIADAVAIAGINDTGRLRYNGRKELAAIAALEDDVTNGSLEQSTTAVLDKISAAALIAGRQRQVRAQLLSGVVEQLLIESKRSRDTEAATMNMQLVTWRDQAAANTAFVAGASDALRTWRQP